MMGADIVVFYILRYLYESPEYFKTKDFLPFKERRSCKKINLIHSVTFTY